MKGAIPVLRLTGIEGFCSEDRYRGYIDLASFALCPLTANAFDRPFGFSFVTASHECIPQLCQKWSERIVIKEAELVVFRNDDRHGVVLLKARMESVSLASIRIDCDPGSEAVVPRVSVDARIESLDLNIGVKMCDGWNVPGGLATVHFRWKVEKKSDAGEK